MLMDIEYSKIEKNQAVFPLSSQKRCLAFSSKPNEKLIDFGRIFLYDIDERSGRGEGFMG